MSKQHLLVFLVSVWLFAICAPTIIHFITEEDRTLTSITLSEEENQEEEGEINISKKLVVEESLSCFRFLIQNHNSLLYEFYLLRYSNNTIKIVLPPPKGFV